MRNEAWVAAGLMACLGCDRGGETAPPTPATQSTAPAGSAAAAEEAADGAREVIKRFGQALRKELTDGLASGGPAGAIGVCHERAPGIAAALEGSGGWSIRRTSTRLRNRANAPDDWERATLERFERDRARGIAIDKLEAIELVDAGGVATWRYMKAIGTEPLCLQCHGAALDAAVTSKLDELYPGDQARGLAAGDLRGAFSLKKPR
jgi:hypothetical protein